MKTALIRRAILSVFLMLVLLLQSAAADTVRLAPLGSAEQIFSAVSVYCNKWCEQAGGTFGSEDMAFDRANSRKIADAHTDFGGNTVTTFDFDGITADVGGDLNVYSITIQNNPEITGMNYYISRFLAVICALGYDMPATDEEIARRYSDLSTEYYTFTDAHREELTDGDIVYWDLETEKGPLEVGFIVLDEHPRITIEKMYFDIP